MNIVQFGHTVGYVVLGAVAFLLVVLGLLKLRNSIQNRNLYKGK